MEKKDKGFLRKFTDKLYGGLNMSWPVVIIYAIATAILTDIFLMVPLFRDTSFQRMGVTFEAWIFFAIIIMANCKKPLESAIKTFVFFLISQPLIYLMQVPFNSMRWGIFGYYKYWFMLTLLTFPMAYVGWYIKKRNWLSLLILSPMLLLLAFEGVNAFAEAAKHFPHLIVTALFCLGQVLIYAYVFTEKPVQKILGILAPFAVAAIILFSRPQVDITGTEFLPGDPTFSENAVLTVSNADVAEITLADEGQVTIHAKAHGLTGFTITDGDKEYNYILDVDEDENRVDRLRIRVQEYRCM